jgi:DnaJ-class molecular chaperone
MEGKFKNHVFLGEGDMLIDGETPLVDGTYELEKFKVNYTHNSLQSKCVFHPKDYNEDLTGNFSGYLGFGIGKAIDTYEKFVVCTFSPDNEDKKRTTSKWEKETAEYGHDLEFHAFWLSKEADDAYAKAKLNDAPQYNNNTTTTSGSTNSGGSIQKLNIRRTCSACGGTGRIGHNETVTQFNSNGKDIKTMKMVYQTCYTCHGSGLL